jgi:hypothetical protein
MALDRIAGEDARSPTFSLFVGYRSDSTETLLMGHGRLARDRFPHNSNVHSSHTKSIT